MFWCLKIFYWLSVILLWCKIISQHLTFFSDGEMLRFSSDLSYYYKTHPYTIDWNSFVNATHMFENFKIPFKCDDSSCYVYLDDCNLFTRLSLGPTLVLFLFFKIDVHTDDHHLMGHLFLSIFHLCGKYFNSQILAYP